MKGFERALAFTLAEETGGDPSGGLTHDPMDTGGTTRWGIAQRWHPGVDVETLTREEATDIYRTSYWEPIRGDELPDPVALVVFDWAVHAGVREAVRGLQRVLGVRVDGVVGPETLDVADSVDPQVLAVRVLELRARSLGALAKRDPTRGAYFMAGYAARLVRATAAALRA